MLYVRPRRKVKRPDNGMRPTRNSAAFIGNHSGG